ANRTAGKHRPESRRVPPGCRSASGTSGPRRVRGAVPGPPAGRRSCGLRSACSGRGPAGTPDQAGHPDQTARWHDPRGGGEPMTEDKLLAEMQMLRDRIAGITGTAVASRDGLIIREDTGGVDPDNLAALTSAALSLAQRLAREAGQG